MSASEQGAAADDRRSGDRGWAPDPSAQRLGEASVNGSGWRGRPLLRPELRRRGACGARRDHCAAPLQPFGRRARAIVTESRVRGRTAVGCERFRTALATGAAPATWSPARTGTFGAGNISS